ncbi:MAG: heavy metal translocating P-type ATPase, partial [Pseudorhodobacter sp.]|nr:heavy metal translocating P-type ATPase [Rhizobacter sp.]
VPGVLKAQVSAASHRATVRYTAPALASHLVRAVEAAGYEAVPDTAAGARGARQKESRTALWRLFVAVFCAMQIMMLATPVYVSSAAGSANALAPDLKRLLEWAQWLLSVPVLWFSSAPFLLCAWRAVRARRINMDVPVALGITTAFMASSGAAFDPGGWFGHEVYFDSLAMFVSFLLGGRYLEMRARHRAEVALEDATARLPHTVMRLLADGTVEHISALRLRVADRVRVPVGQGFAADGVVTQGSTQADESMLTGESRPVVKRTGDAVVAGSINLSAPVEMQVQRVGADTRFEAIVALMRGARTQRPALLAAADQWATPFLWAVLLLAAAAGAAWSVIDPSRAVWVVVAVLIVTCPCALSLAAPSAMLAAAGAMGSSGTGGLLLRRLDAIQNLARMQVLFVDKTGTLTQQGLNCAAELACQDQDGGEVDRENECSISALQGTAASLAAWSTHPASKVVSSAFEAQPIAWREVREVPGAGLEALDEQGQVWRLGGAAWASAPSNPTDETGTCHLSRNGRVLLHLHLTEHLRDDAAEAVRALQADGVRVQLLSGDEPARAQRVAATLGLTAADISAGLTPDAKLAAVRAAQQGGLVVGMLGDGINDAPVLALADVSIAMSDGALVARTQADAVLISNRLLDVVRARALAQRTLRVIRQNLVWAALYNAACVPLALMGALPPWAAGLGMASSSLFVVLNSMRLSKRQLK